ncbi:MAG: dihydrolipoyl dehydrogenase [Dehalococcoidia bacterium]|nr:dihydrolipoyl dehydrogenase [Dehalococcoidia bacterium]
MDEYDVAVIGGGPGGYVAAIRAAQLGASTALIEKDRIGGVCLNRGCIPTKALLQGVSYLGAVERGRNYGLVVGDVSLDYGKLQRTKANVVNSLVDDVTNLLIDDGVEIIEGIGRLTSAGQVEVTSQGGIRTLGARKVILATGSAPARPPIPGVDSPRVLTSDQVLALETLPHSLAVIGGGVVGVEIATIFARLGVEVSIVEMMSQVLPGEDAEIAAELSRLLGKMGIQVLVGAKVEGIRTDSRDLAQVMVSTGGAERRLEAEYVLVAAGRKPALGGLGLEEAGIEVISGAIKVNRQMETSVHGIYAVGDAVGGIMLAHVASREGIVAVENALGHDAAIDYRGIPRCVYTIPEVAAAGLTEQQALQEGYDVAAGRFEFRANGRARIAGETDGFVKVVVDRKYGEVLGVHILGPHATELIGQATLAIKAELSADVVRSNLAAHPTLSEALAEALEDTAGRAIHVPLWKG